MFTAKILFTLLIICATLGFVTSSLGLAGKENDLAWTIIFFLSGGTLLGVLTSVLLFSQAAKSFTHWLTKKRNKEKAPLPGFPSSTWKKLGEDIDTLLTEADAAEQAAEERYHTLVDNLAAGVIIREGSGETVFCSPYTEVLTGFSRDEIYASPKDFFLSIVHEEDREIYERSLRVSQFGEPFQFRYRFYHKTGILMWAETRTVPLLDEQGDVSGSLSVTLDVTATIRHQQQIEEKNRDLKDFSYMITHDLKAPIVTVKGMSGVLREDFTKQLPEDSRSDFEETVGHVFSAAQRLEALVKSVLDYSKLGAQKVSIESIDLNTVFADVRSGLTTQLREVGGTCEIPAGLPEVKGEYMVLLQVFSNLLENAIKYREPSRELRIRIKEVPIPNIRRTMIAVEDNGTGIPENMLTEIFRPFKRAHGRSIEGSGVGLATVHKLLHQIGGEIHVESTVGEGSAFYVTLRKVAT